MTADLETRLRQVLEHDASRAPLVERAPEALRLRVRRRQARSVAVGVAGLVAVVAVAFAGLQLMNGDDRFTPTPAEQHERPVFERTAAIEGFTVTSPSDWYLVDYWPVMRRALEIEEAVDKGETVPGSEWYPGAAGVPVLQLTNHDPGLGAPICGSPTGDNPFPADGVGLYVGFDLGRTRLGDGVDEWPTAFSVEPTSCNGGTELRFGVRRGDRMVPYLLWYGAGPDASDEDRARLDAIVESFDVAVGQPEIRLPGTDTPGFVLWGGTEADGSTWTIEGRPTEENLDLKLVTREADGSYSEGGYGDFDVPPKDVEGGFMGVVSEDAERVEFLPADGSQPLVAELTDLPASLGYDADAYYFASGFPTKDEPANGEVVAIVPGPSPATPTDNGAGSPTAVAVSPRIVGEGVSDDRRYRVEMFSFERGEGGGAVVMAELYARPLEDGGTWQRLQTAAFEPDADLDYATFSFPWNGQTMPFITYGIAAPNAEQVRADLESGGFIVPRELLRSVRVPIAGTDGDVVLAWVELFDDPEPGTIRTTVDGVESIVVFEPAPEGSPLSSADGVTVFHDDAGANDWRANVAWSNQGVLGDVTVQATPHGSGERPDGWPGWSQTLSLADGFSFVAVAMPGPETSGCLETRIVGVFDPGRVATVTLDGEPLELATKDLGTVHLDHAGNTIFSAAACDVEGMTARIAALDATGHPVVEANLLPAPLPAD